MKKYMSPSKTLQSPLDRPGSTQNKNSNDKKNLQQTKSQGVLRDIPKQSPMTSGSKPPLMSRPSLGIAPVVTVSLKKPQAGLHDSLKQVLKQANSLQELKPSKFKTASNQKQTQLRKQPSQSKPSIKLKLRNTQQEPSQIISNSSGSKQEESADFWKTYDQEDAPTDFFSHVKQRNNLRRQQSEHSSRN